MAKTKTSKRSSKDSGEISAMVNGHAKSNQSPEQLYEAALTLVEQSQPQEALNKAKQLWSQVQHGGVSQALPALNLLGDISVELGEVEEARDYFEKAVALDPTGAVPEAMGGGAEKFLWLAQLCETGGQESVKWFEKGITALQAEIATLNGGVAGVDEDTLLLMRVEKKKKLANALCGIVEIYMTDLSWEDDAETRCENLITEAMAAEDDTSPEVLQTLASVRLSQERMDDARAALRRSLELWSDLDPEDDAVPDFATKISLSRLLMEAGMDSEAMDVLNRLVLEDDQSIEAWYLGGWCQHLVAGRPRSDAQVGKADVSEDLEPVLKGSRHWLKTAIKLYAAFDYEDVRLFEHAQELVAELDTMLGPEDEQAEAEEDQYEEWHGAGHELDDSDDEMGDT